MTQTAHPRWGDTVVESTVRGHPVFVYEHRVRSVGAVMREGRRWCDREFMVHGARRVSFAAHEAAVARLATALANSGVGQGDRVALFAANCPEWVAAFFATLELGAVVVPCNGWWSPREIAHALTMTSPTVVLADDPRCGRLPAGTPTMLLDEFAPAFQATKDPGPETTSSHTHEDEDRAAVILFTSGTTGFPKGATLSHRSMVANVQNLLVASGRLPHQVSDDRSDAVTLSGLPLFHIGALQGLLVPFVSGAKLVFQAGRFDAGEVLRLIEQERVTTWAAVPTMVERVLAHPDLPGRELTSLRTVIVGGATVSAGLLQRVTTAFPNASRGVGQLYGLSEAGGVLTTGVAKDQTPPGSVGRIVPVAEVRINEPDEHGIGEVWARSPSVMDGYWGLPDDPVLTGDGWLRTGDLGRLDDQGYLYITGRLKDMIIRGGENIAPAHIEISLLEHSDVREVAVVGLPDPDFGEAVGAVVSLAPDSTVDAAGLAAFLGPRLAHFEVPSHWWFTADDLPKNDSGKILKYQLRNQWIERGI